METLPKAGCSQCSKPKVYCKEMCHSCYKKMYRKTKKGKKQMDEYNASAKGKEAQRKHRELKNASKPLKPPKPNCECGKPSICKKMCASCYYKHYRKNNYKKHAQYNTNLKGIGLDVKIFNAILVEVEKGFTIQKACKNVNIHRTTLYLKMSPMQKSELIAYRSIGRIYNKDM